MGSLMIVIALQDILPLVGQALDLKGEASMNQGHPDTIDGGSEDKVDCPDMLERFVSYPQIMIKNKLSIQTLINLNSLLIFLNKHQCGLDFPIWINSRIS